MALRKGSKPVSITHPHLMDEWDFEKNGGIRPEDFSYGSNRKVHWICKKEDCGHGWQATIKNRTKEIRPTSCPRCAAEVRAHSYIISCIERTGSLAETHPVLCKEWHPTKNGVLCPEGVSSGSGRKIWWCCLVCKYVWEAPVSSRAVGEHCTGCPACNRNVVSDINRLSILYSELCEEWDYSKNNSGPGVFSYGSNEIVWWKCKNKKCSHSWCAVISNRTKKINPTGCPACSNSVVTDKNNLAVLFPELAQEWHKTKNGGLRPEDVVPGSNKKVFWDCLVCGNEWGASVCSRTGSRNTGCPECAKEKVRLMFNYDFSFAKKAFDSLGLVLLDKKYINTKTKMLYRCKVCKHEGLKTLGKVQLGRGCPVCAKSPISKISQRWLSLLGVDKKYREYTIPKMGFRVDGFDPETNTVYEFLGDYWHGNPARFNPRKKNKTVGKLYRQLYQEWLDRKRLLEEAGYKVIYIWEADFKKQESMENK